MAAYKKRLPSTEELLDLAKKVHAESARLGIPSAVLGGLAMNLYGSARLTKDVDFVSDRLIDPPPAGLSPMRKIAFGGEVYGTDRGIDVDWIVREDHYAGLYREALLGATTEMEDLPVVGIEFLAAIKFAASVRNPKHYDDLLFLLVHPDIDLTKTKNIVFKHVGGAFGVEQLEAAIDEAVWRKGSSEGRP
ncbi:MAG: hypothetical protein HYY17_06165 [Planctomycetes bacterium]|nr:hypothetical protein [Planctomycetota bacterium]